MPAHKDICFTIELDIQKTLMPTEVAVSEHHVTDLKLEPLEGLTLCRGRQLRLDKPQTQYVDAQVQSKAG